MDEWKNSLMQSPKGKLPNHQPGGRSIAQTKKSHVEARRRDCRSADILAAEKCSPPASFWIGCAWESGCRRATYRSDRSPIPEIQEGLDELLARKKEEE